MRFSLIFGFCAVLMLGCVSRKQYYAEQLARRNADGQVIAFSKELAERKREQSAQVKTIGELNREIGSLQKEIEDLRSELAQRTEAMGASTQKLMDEKRDLELRYNAASKTLELRDKELELLQTKAAAVRNQLAADFGVLENQVISLIGNGVTLAVNEDHIQATVQDAILFDRDGLKLSPSAPGFMLGFSQFLSERPAYKVQIHTHVDNTLPARQRDITDSWGFSQARALAIVRALVSNYNVNAYMLAPVARGEYQPVASNSEAEGRSANRRTVFLIYPQ